MNMKFPGAVPEIPVSNLKKAGAYYEGSLGFTIRLGQRRWRNYGNLKRTMQNVSHRQCF